MGSCASVHKNGDSAMKLRCTIGSKTTDNVLVESPIKENIVNSEHPIAETSFKPQSSPVPHLTSLQDLRSKEEMFFDSHPWLESDCEDFFSVNGDFTPSRSNTPIHQSSFAEIPRLDRSFYPDGTPNFVPEPSPNDKKKKLVELFRESFEGNPVDGDQNLKGTESIMANGRLEAKPITYDLPPKFSNRSPYASVANSVCCNERTPKRGAKPEKEKAAHSVQCCLPSLVRSLSFSEKKKRLIPAHSNGG